MSEENFPVTEAALTTDLQPEDQEQAVLLSTDANPVPERHIAGYFTARDGISLRYAIFKNGSGTAKGTIVLLHGRNEFIEKYFETIRHFTDLGFWVATFDWRGQGGSDRMLKNPLRGHVRRFTDHENDLSHFLETIVLPDTRLPFLLIAHSMGALVALSSAPKLANRIDRMALLAPFLDLSDQKFSSRAIYGICRILSFLGLGWLNLTRDVFPRPFEGNVLTADKARFKRNQDIYKAHPQLRVGPPSARWIAVMLGAMKKVRSLRHLDSIKVPTLLLAASADKIVALRVIETLANRFRAGALVTIDGARHELLQETDRHRLAAIAAIDAFLLPDEDISPRDLVGITKAKSDTDQSQITEKA